MKKYELIICDKVGFYQIKALRTFNDVKMGDLGGYIENENNLSHSGYAWVFENARVYGDAQVSGDAWVSGDAQVYEDAQVYGDAQVFGNAQVSGDARVYGNAWVSGDAQVSRDARVYGDAQVYGNARVYGDAQVNQTPFCISGLIYHVTITETHIFIGCKGSTKREWLSFSDEDINSMDESKSLIFWNRYKKHILWLAFEGDGNV